MGAKIALPEEAQQLEHMTNFKVKELKRWYKTFMHNNPDGQLSKEKFQEIYCQLFECEHLSNHIFNKLDLNHDGHISFRELMLNFSITMKGSKDEKLGWVFDVYDVDGNGEITLSEMKHVLVFVHGSSGASEIPIESVFNIVDLDSNGVLSRQEFVEGMKKYPSFSNMLKLQQTHKRETDNIKRKNTCQRKESTLREDVG